MRCGNFCRFFKRLATRGEAMPSAYAAIKLLAGRPNECPAAVYVVAVVFALKFALL